MPQLKLLLKLSRPHQWLKNLLLAVAPLLAHEWMNLETMVETFIAIIFFSLLASSVYIVNDLLDRKADRAHPTKRFRPLASGAVRPRVALILGALLLTISLTGSLLLLPLDFFWILLLYLSATLLYSFIIKHKLALDVIMLTLLYVLRVYAGGVATQTLVSNWLLTFSLFFFASLALAKRYFELDARTKREDQRQITIRSYRHDDLRVLGAAGISCGLLSVLVLSLYIQSSAVQDLYRSPAFLWLICPVTFYWIIRLWLKTYRGEIDHDPIVFAIQDIPSYGSLIVVGLVLLAARYLPIPTIIL